jgi:hypothetical protein
MGARGTMSAEQILITETRSKELKPQMSADERISKEQSFYLRSSAVPFVPSLRCFSVMRFVKLG